VNNSILKIQVSALKALEESLYKINATKAETGKLSMNTLCEYSRFIVGFFNLFFFQILII